jgi:hypothetical protein
MSVLGQLRPRVFADGPIEVECFSDDFQGRSTGWAGPAGGRRLVAKLVAKGEC